MIYPTATPGQRAKIRDWIKHNEPTLYDLIKALQDQMGGRLIEIVRQGKELSEL